MIYCKTVPTQRGPFGLKIQIFPVSLLNFERETLIKKFRYFTRKKIYLFHLLPFVRLPANE